MDTSDTDSESLIDEVLRLTCVTHGIANSYEFHISVIKEQNVNNPSYLLRCRRRRLGEADTAWTRRVDMDRFDSLIRQLAQSSIRVIPEEMLVCDGSQYELTINRGSNSVTYRWTEPPSSSYGSIDLFTRSWRNWEEWKGVANNDRTGDVIEREQILAGIPKGMPENSKA